MEMQTKIVLYKENKAQVDPLEDEFEKVSTNMFVNPCLECKIFKFFLDFCK